MHAFTQNWTFLHFGADTPHKIIPAQTHQSIKTSKVKKTLKEIENKAPGIDNLASDVMVLGGEESV